MNNENSIVEITYGDKNLKEVYSEILKQEFIKILKQQNYKGVKHD